MNKKKNLMKTKTTLRGTNNFSSLHFLRRICLFSMEISEKLWMNGHFQSKQQNPHSRSVPNLKDRSFRISFTARTPSDKPLFTMISATCKNNTENTRHQTIYNMIRPRSYQHVLFRTLFQ
ncbi:hypothetical protein LINPERPRIM_LOCUS13871 [Linum perenne]